MILIATGSGGTGKTTVMQKIADELKLPFMKSVVRDFYSIKGIPEGETELAKWTIDHQFSFQLELFNHYCVKFKDFKDENPQGFVSDRSPFCHFGYVLTYAPQLVNLPSLKSLIQTAGEIASYCGAIIHFPYPVSWSKDKDDDSFRVIPAGKNYIHNGLVQSCFRSAKEQHKDFPSMFSVPDTTVEKRIEFIRSVIRYTRIDDRRKQKTNVEEEGERASIA